jgi:hypothetical protein
MRRSLMAGLTVVAALAVPAAPALADNSFDGSCKNIQGSAKFDVPLSNTAGDNTYHFSGKGQCSGKLNGADVTDSPIDAQVDGPFNGSCQSSASTAPGPGKLVFTKGTPATGDDITVTFTMTFTGTASEVDFKLAGTKSGTATGHASFLTSRTPPDILIKCANGGNSELPFDATADTDSPLTSSAPAQSSSGQSSPSGGGQQQSPPPQGGSSGSGGSQPSGGASNPAAPTTALSIEVPAQSWSDVLAHGLRVVCHVAGPANCVLKASLSRKAGKRMKLTGTIANGRASIASGADSATVVAKLTGKARKKLRKLSSITLTVIATAGGKRATKTVTLRR